VAHTHLTSDAQVFVKELDVEAEATAPKLDYNKMDAVAFLSR
jgi:hypothetical protein